MRERDEREGEREKGMSEGEEGGGIGVSRVVDSFFRIGLFGFFFCD